MSTIKKYSSRTKTPIQKLIELSAEKTPLQKPLSGKMLVGSLLVACLIVGFFFWVALSSYPVAYAMSRALEGISL